MADALSLLQSGTNDKLGMITVRKLELNDLWIIEIKMSLFVGIISDLSNSWF